MIVEIIDHGWGPEWPIKQMEMQVTRDLLKNHASSQRRTVVINSTWYGHREHEQTISHLRQTEFDDIVLVSMIDPAIPRADWFAQFGHPVLSLGSYPGAGEFVFWAWVLDRYLDPPDLDSMTDVAHIDTPFMCLNRKPHWHRRQLYEHMQQLDILDRGLVTMGTDGDQAERTLPIDISHQDLSPNSAVTNHGIINDNVSLGHIDNWQRHFLNVVTETMWDINHTWFVSEKIFKPIIGCRPFLVYDPDGAHRWLTQHGFESFVNDFGDISDLDLCKPENLAPFLLRLTQQGTGYWKSKYLDLLPKIMHNKSKFDQLIQQHRQLLQQGLSCQT